MKYFFCSLLSFLISISAFAQNNLGVDYFSLGEMKLAKEYFTKNVGVSPAESHYYLGEIAYREGNMAEAKSQYEQGLASDPTAALPAIGLAKLQLKSNTKAAEDQLKDIQKKNRKDMNVILAIAQAYLDNGMKAKAMDRLQDARKADRKSPAIYIFEGDMLAKENKPGDAAMQYDQAINFDANCVLAYMKGAFVYEFINRKTATDKLKKVIEIRPDFRIAYKALADISYRDGFYPAAIEAFEKYFEGGSYTMDDITRYAAAQYFTQQYDAAKTLIQEGLTKDANNFVLNRLLMYTSNDTKDFATGVAAGDKFFSIPRDDSSRYLVQDYLSFANVLSETGNKTKAVEQYKKAIELDPTKIDLYKEIATILARENMEADAAEFYKTFIEKSGESAQAIDYFQLGRYYYFAGENAKNDTVNMTKEQAWQKAVAFYNNADATFAVVAERIPESYMGNFWRARVNALLDPETTGGLARPYYEKTAEIIVAGESSDNNVQLIEAYRYLAYYYYLQFDKSKKAEDKAQVKAYSEKILGIDPNNATAQQFLEFANSK
jgi:Tfp pilus assembly protein PilF